MDCLYVTIIDDASMSNMRSLKTFGLHFSYKKVADGLALRSFLIDFIPNLIEIVLVYWDCI